MGSITQHILRSLPPSWRHRAVEIKNTLWGGFKQRHYSQFGEDVVLRSMLTGTKGFYVDVGANHPSRYSNTKLLYDRGWHGINIEPNKDGVQRFKKARPRDTTLCLGVGIQEEKKTYYRFSDPAYNTFSKDAAEALEQKKWLAKLQTEEVSVLPLKDILDKHLPEGMRVEYLNVDAEGHDMEVLQSNDWSKYPARVISVEAHAFDPAHPHTSAVYAYLTARGYELASFMRPTLIFKMKEN